ncbi:GNAT family N-acetyltransferase [Saccharibacillus sp. JS10]|uniref:GNAT family N-acetyltransferase n=1 Tax=Saccharibacillus sp. JS10 TaxID=2950552 RepID=UPI00210EE077|nr:GNAT family N-acetyltransferase [Saccharibacillus sp. JS10]MCQ4088799.1 GNAT family N-acetyltransferase [Saccharibacillus sp. JS10]
MSYQILGQNHHVHASYRISRLEESYMQSIKRWRNEQMDVLRQGRLLTDEDQQQYYRQVIEPSFNQTQPKLMLFGFFLDNELIGYGGLTNLNWEHKRAEISYLLQTERSSEQATERYTSDFGSFLSLMKQIAFDELGLHRLFTETYDIRPLHVRVLEQNGFIYEGRMLDHVYINGRYVDSLLHGCLKG